MDFLVELNLRIDEDESIKLMISKAVVGLSSRLSKMTMNDDYKVYINVSPQFPHCIKKWLIRNIGHETIVLVSEICDCYFTGPCLPDGSNST
jgi:ubiquitin conjugation factor E4 B